MRNCLVVFFFFFFFSLWCIYLSVRGLKLAHSGVEVVQNTSSSSCTSSNNCNGSKVNCNSNQNLSEVEQQVHRRSKRYLFFEKGSFVSVTTAAVKSILPAIPRGFNIIVEESLYYELPTSLMLPKKNIMKPVGKTKNNLVKAPAKTNDFHKHGHKNYDFNEWNNFPNYGYPKYYHNNERNYVQHPEYDPNVKRRRLRDVGEELASLIDIDALFFQEIENFAKRLGFNGRYCVMRTLCEAKHLLFAEGQSLFHDIIRIILESSLPKIEKDPKYYKAWNIEHLMDCANLYGPHCKISFIDFFTYQIHGPSN
ncbi:uncharacterized protein LOC129906604 [Episyrphus balteatus]|uniref:uncharacterized protein LOC129906604 n=1 Tax=Episyrphus balteatus TaxID=286459 RepID=UPI0024866741|nr:uncharacterized protein LOC129906604 [Episyrphus balteatus]